MRLALRRSPRCEVLAAVTKKEKPFCSGQPVKVRSLVDEVLARKAASSLKAAR
tara:strand:- start:531 stop:689 length:159 start_codon:yes stop_codon:yes gene_type:complete